MTVGLSAQLIAALQHTLKDVSCACSRAHQLYAVVGGISAESEGTACGDHCGILEKGTLFEENPHYTHSYGEFVPEIIEIDKTLREILHGGEE